MNKQKTEGLPYRPCVGVLVINGHGQAWVGRRIGGAEHADPDHAWQMPQGGIDQGEDPLAAARRELFEETGMETVTLVAEAPDWFCYDLPADVVGKAWKGKYRGQTQKWYAFRFDGAESEIRINPPPAGHEAEFCEWRWEDLENLPNLIVPFKRPVYEQVVAAFKILLG